MRSQSLPLAARLVRQRLAAQPFAQRFASSSTESAAESAKSAAEGAKKATQSATASAQKYLGTAAERGQNLVKGVTERTSGLLGAYRGPVIYNLSVGRELLKQVYISERLAPPTSISEITKAYQTIFKNAQDLNWWKGIVESGEWKRLAVYAVEAYGIFTIGEMIGRRHMVGYKLD